MSRQTTRNDSIPIEILTHASPPMYLLYQDTFSSEVMKPSGSGTLLGKTSLLVIESGKSHSTGKDSILPTGKGVITTLLHKPTADIPKKF
nr:unnamed protein product [Callosobruchus analis]